MGLTLYSENLLNLRFFQKFTEYQVYWVGKIILLSQIMVCKRFRELFFLEKLKNSVTGQK